MRERGKTQGPNSASGTQRQEGGAEQEYLFQHLCAREMPLLSAFPSVPGGYLSTSALCRASSSRSSAAPLPQEAAACKGHDSAFNILILNVTDFPFSAR